MLKKTIKNIKNKFEKKKFKEDIKKQKRKIFIDLNKNDKSFKKRKKLSIKIPNLSKFKIKFTKKHLYIGLSLSFILLLCFLFLFIFSPFFYISKIDISIDKDSENLINLDLAYNSVKSIRNKNILFTEKSEIEELVNNWQKNIVKISINKNIFKGSIKIKLYSSKALYKANYMNHNYFITNNGVFIPAKNTNIAGLKELKLSLSDNNINFIDYKIILDEKNLNKIIEITEKLSKNINSISIGNIYYFVKEREVHIDVNNDLKLIFDLEANLDEQIMKIVVFVKEYINITKDDSINYIDLRIYNKVFFCENINKGVCQNNLKYIYPLYNEKNK